MECYDLVDQLARMLKADGDARPIGALRAFVLSALIRRPADHGLPPVRADVRVTADLDALRRAASTPGEVDGLPITAAHVRELLARVGALGLTAPEGGSLGYAITGPDGRAAGHRHPCRAGPHRQAAAALPTRPATAAARCWSRHRRPRPTNRPTGNARSSPPATGAAGSPTAGNGSGWADLDHVIPHACGGETDCANLCCLCRSHHRLKTFAPGWHFAMTPRACSP